MLYSDTSARTCTVRHIITIATIRFIFANDINYYYVYDVKYNHNTATSKQRRFIILYPRDLAVLGLAIAFVRNRDPCPLHTS